MNTKNVKYIPFIIIVSLIIIFVSRNMSNHILLFPFWLNAILYFTAMPISYFYIKKGHVFSSDKEENKKTASFFNGVLAVLVAFVLLCAFRLPINVYIKHKSKNNEVLTQTCPITYYSLSLKNQQKKHITFTFHDKPIRMKVKHAVMNKIKLQHASQKSIQLNFRKSILGTYVVEDFDVN